MIFYTVFSRITLKIVFLKIMSFSCKNDSNCLQLLNIHKLTWEKFTLILITQSRRFKKIKLIHKRHMLALVIIM